MLHNLLVGNGELVQEALSSLCSAIAERGDEAAAYGHACMNLLPESSRRYVLATFPSYALRWGFKTERAFVLDPSVSVVDRDLFGAAKDVLSGTHGSSVWSADQREVSVLVDREDGNVVLEYSGAESNIRTKIPELKLLSPESETRLDCLQGILKRLGPTAPDMTDLISALQVRQPNDEELSTFFHEAVNGVASVQGVLSHKIRFGLPVNVGDIIPQDISYYEKFIGQRPEDHDLEFYIREILIPYRRALLDQDLGAGLEICLLGALRDDLCPGRWVDDIEDDAVLEALSKCDTEGSPIALLGALDVALYRQGDKRFREFAEQAILRLCDERLGIVEGVDIYELLWCFVQLMVNQINLMENGAKLPGFWKRICAWMQAQFVVRCLLKGPSAIAIDELKTWCHSSMELPGAYAELVNFREEPMLLNSARTLPSDLRSEVLGRLTMLRLRHEGEGRHVPHTEEIDQSMGCALERGDWFKCYFPGPLEGCRKIVRPLPDELADDLRKNKPDIGDPASWQFVGNCSHVFRLSVAEIEPVTEAVKEKVNRIDARQSQNYLFSLEIASYVAKSTRDVALADAIGDALVDIAKGVSDAHDTHMIVQICIVAAAAYEERKAWLDWLEERLARIASVIPGPPNRCLGIFVGHLDSIETILPTDSWFHRRGRYIAASGAFLGP